MKTCSTAPAAAHCFHYTIAELRRQQGGERSQPVERVCCYCGMVLETHPMFTHRLRDHGQFKPVEP